jgi:hypothetical protein
VLRTERCRDVRGNYDVATMVTWGGGACDLVRERKRRVLFNDVLNC